MKYKVDDEVKVISQQDCVDDDTVGDTVFIEDVDQHSSPSSDGIDRPYLADNGWWYGESELEPTQPKNLQVKLKQLTDTAVIPRYATEGSACFDLVADEDIIVSPGCTVAVSTGLSFEIPVGYKLCIYARSGISRDTPLRIANAPAQIDSDYRGEVKVLLWNSGVCIGEPWIKTLTTIDNSEIEVEDLCRPRSYKVFKGDRIAQAEVVPVTQVSFEVADELSKTVRGNGGFGHTGT